MYFVLDSLNIGYEEMLNTYGVYLVVINILLNLIMAFTSAFMWNVSTALVKLTGKEGKGSFFSGFAYIFGMFTYGCTPCVIALFSTIGLTFSVAILPLAGLPYKFIALTLLIFGFVWLRYEANHVKCKVKKE
jgi:fatty acid desaturase